MKHLIILVLAVLSLNQNANALGKKTPQLPTYIYAFDLENPNSPSVISKQTIQVGAYHNAAVIYSALYFWDTKTMKILEETTGIAFNGLWTALVRDHLGETDSQLNKINGSAKQLFEQHLVSWKIYQPKYRVQREPTYINCNGDLGSISEFCSDINSRPSCQLIKSVAVEMAVYHKLAFGTSTLFTGEQEKVIDEWKPSLPNEPCKTKSPNKI